MAEKKPEKAENKPKKKVEYAAGIYPKRPLKDNEVNIRNMTFDKSALETPEFIKKLPIEEQQAIANTPYDNLSRAQQGPWKNDQQRQATLKWLLGQSELKLWKQENPTAWENFKEVFPRLIFTPLAYAAKDAVVNAATGIKNALAGGGTAENAEPISLTRFKERDIYTPEQKAALDSLIPEVTQSLKQMHAEGRQPIPTWQQIPWESLADLASAGTNYYANASALADAYRHGEIPQLTASLEALGAPVNSSAYQNALSKSGQSYNDRLWALRAAAASQALKAVGSLGAHGRNLEETRQRRFQQLSNLSNITANQAFAPQSQVLSEQLQPPAPSWQQTLGDLGAKFLPAAINVGAKAAGVI
jgi:hypothetical protein